MHRRHAEGAEVLVHAQRLAQPFESLRETSAALASLRRLTLLDGVGDEQSPPAARFGRRDHADAVVAAGGGHVGEDRGEGTATQIDLPGELGDRVRETPTAPHPTIPAHDGDAHRGRVEPQRVDRIGDIDHDPRTEDERKAIRNLSRREETGASGWRDPGRPLFMAYLFHLRK